MRRSLQVSYGGNQPIRVCSRRRKVGTSHPFLKQVRKVGTSPSVPDSLDALRGAFKASARPGRTQAPDTGLRLRPVGPFAKRESDSARELKARRTGGGQCRWSQRVAP